MTSLVAAGYRAHALTVAFARRVKEAEAIVREGLRRAPASYVSFSAGKDSSVLLDLVARQDPTIAARMLSSGESRTVHANLDAVLTWWRSARPALDLRELLVDRVFSADWQGATWDESRKAGRGDLATRLRASGDFTGYLLGLRAEESAARATSLRLDGPIARVDGLWRICPLARWTTDDVGAYVVTRGLPLLAAYHAAEGLDARTTMRMTGDAVRGGAVRLLRTRDRAGYNRLVQRFPELHRWA